MAKMKEQKRGEIILYKAKQGPQVEVRLEHETVWLDARQIASLFGTQRPAIVKHINNIYRTAELSPDSTCSILEQVATDGKIRKINDCAYHSASAVATLYFLSLHLLAE